MLSGRWAITAAKVATASSWLSSRVMWAMTQSLRSSSRGSRNVTRLGFLADPSPNNCLAQIPIGLLVSHHLANPALRPALADAIGFEVLNSRQAEINVFEFETAAMRDVTTLTLSVAG